MLGITLRDRKRSTLIIEKIKVKDIIQVVKQQKWRWAGQAASMNDNRWMMRITDWHPYNDKQSRKRPDRRWKARLKNFQE